MHDSMDVRVYLSVASNPVIENCSAIAFAEHPLIATLHDPSINRGQPPNVSTSNLFTTYSDMRPRVNMPKYKIFHISGRRRRQTGFCGPLETRTGTTFHY